MALTKIKGAGINISATEKLYFDGGGNTYIQESGADVLDFYVGGANMLKLTESSTNTFAITGNTTITTADNTDTLALVSTDADANAGPNLNLYRNSSSPADNDFLGNIKFNGRNDNSQDVQYAEIEVYATDVSDGTEDGLFNLNLMTGGTNRTYMQLQTDEVVFNEDSADIDFRVESNGNANMLFVDAGNDRIGIGTASPAGILDVQGGRTHLKSNDEYNLRLYASNGDSGKFIGTPAGDKLSIYSDVGNAEVTVDASGNVGIGTTSPTSGVLVVKGSGDLLTLESTNSGTGGAQLNLNHVGGSQADGDSVGRILFNGQDSGDNSVTYARIDGIAEDVTDGSENGALNFDTRTSNSAFSTKMTIASAGPIIASGNTSSASMINTAHTFYMDQADTAFAIDNESSGNAFGLQIRYSATGHGTSGYFISCYANPSGSLQARFIVAEDGDVTNSNNSYGSISDQRVKKDITDANSQWDDIKALKIRNYKKDEAGDGSVQIGVVAQELEEAGMNGLVDEAEATDIDVENFPNINEGDKIKSVKYSVLYMKSIKALQEAMSKIETLESKVEELEGD